MSGQTKPETSFEIRTEEGDFCAGCDTFEEALHYAMVYGQDGPVDVWFVEKRKLLDAKGTKLQ